MSDIERAIADAVIRERAAIEEACETYVLVGNQRVHARSALWSRPHRVVFPPFVFSRAHNGSPDFVATWNRTGRQ